jgi:UDP-3-O-[3-hydroxymyristoyl] glucosamine N-acyltransferase
MKLGEIARLVGGELKGDPEVDISGIAPLESAGPGDLTFLANRKYARFLKATRASAILLPQGEWDLPQALILCEDPYFAFARIMQEFYGTGRKLPPGVHPSAVVAEGVTIGEGVAIGPFVTVEEGVQIGDRSCIYPGSYIGKDVVIGADVLIYPNVTVREGTRIGNRVIIQPGAVIGSDGFGFAQHNGVYYKIPQVGRVVIEDDVEIGANTCIDRATLGETRIKKGVKLDNLIQIAHNVEVGEHTVIAAQTGISGSTRVGHHVMMGGQVGVVGHITIGDHAICGAQAGVTKPVPEKTFVSGYPARPHRQELRIEASVEKLPDLIRHIRELENRIAELERKLDMKNLNQTEE